MGKKKTTIIKTKPKTNIAPAAVNGSRSHQTNLKAANGRLSPWLVLPTGKHGHRLYFTDITDSDNNFNQSFMEIRKRKCLTSSNGWFVMMDMITSPHKSCLWNPHTRQVIDLPLLHENLCDYSRCVLLFPPTHPDCMVLFWKPKDKLFLFCEQGDENWTKQYPCDHLLESNGAFSEFIASTEEGCIYAHTCKGRLATITRDPCGLLSITHLDIERPRVYDDSFSLKHFLLEFLGEICLVVLHFAGVGVIKGIAHVEIFKMDAVKKVWIKVEHLGDYIIFLSFANSFTLPAKKARLKGNSIYFNLTVYEGFHVYDLEEDSLSFCSSNLPITSKYWSGFWLMPLTTNTSDIPIAEQTTITNKEEELKVIKIMDHNSTTEITPENILCKLSSDMISLIALCLPMPIDYMNFRLVCRTISSCLPPIRWTVDPAQCPWLMFCHREKTTCNFLDPLMPSVIHDFRMPELRGARISSSKDGWLLLRKGGRSMFFFNPFTKVTIQLPDLEDNIVFNGVCFSAPPTSSDCTIFGISMYRGVLVSLLRLGEEAWTYIKCENKNFEILSSVSPVFYDGVFYMLGYEGHLGIFNLKGDRNNMTVIDTPYPLRSDILQDYLVEHHGEILAIFVGYKGNRVTVYKLDGHDMSWTIQGGLEDQMLFVSRSGFYHSKGRLKQCKTRSISHYGSLITIIMCSTLWTPNVGIPLLGTVSTKISLVSKNSCIVPGFNLV